MDHDTVTYDFADWSEGQRRVLELLLGGSGVPFSWENGVDLVVPSVAEGTVDELLEQLENLPLENPSDEDSRAQVEVELGALTLRRVGTVMQYVGGIGVLVTAIEAYSTWDSVTEGEFSSGPGLLQKLAFVLGAYNFLLMAALVVGLGTLCRLFADWALLRLPAPDREAPVSPVGPDANQARQNRA